MEIVVRKTDLQRELSLLQNIVERKITIPVLANDRNPDNHTLLLVTDQPPSNGNAFFNGTAPTQIYT